MGDLISRQAVIERLKKEDKILYTTTGLNYLIRAIKELPSVTQKSETVTEFADRCRECGAKYGKLLKQAQSGDLISRQAAIEAIYDNKDRLNIAQAIRELPSVNPQEPKWIPVSERLPEESGEYLITIKDRTYRGISWFYSSDKKWSYRNAEIIAWMPLPKPYEPQESEE